MIGVLAYGSLISVPGDELAAVTVGRTNEVMTPFSVEFARSSNGRAGAPTLVPVEGGGSPVRAVIFTVDTSPEEAANIVYRRETNQVGSGKVYSEPPPNWRNAVRIDRLEGLAGYDLVLSTRLAANINPLTAETLADLAIESARNLDNGRDGISYLIAARASGIATPLTPDYEAAILAKTGAADLAAALVAVRAEAEDRPLAVEAGPRWSIWIDIEGFGKLWVSGTLALKGLRALMSGIYAVGSKAYTGDGDRLFAHQFGDGFVIVGDFHEEALDRCVAIAVVLMRHVAKSGCLARAAIAEGDFADYSGCWPAEIRQEMANLQSDDTVRLGSGIMTLLPVMGTALINANKLDSSNSIKGAVLTISSKDAERVTSAFPRRVSATDRRLTMVDWIHAASPFIEEIVAKSGVGNLSPVDVEAAVDRYMAQAPVPPPAWVIGTREYGSVAAPLLGAGGTT